MKVETTRDDRYSNGAENFDDNGDDCDDDDNDDS